LYTIHPAAIIMMSNGFGSCHAVADMPTYESFLCMSRWHKQPICSIDDMLSSSSYRDLRGDSLYDQHKGSYQLALGGSAMLVLPHEIDPSRQHLIPNKYRAMTHIFKDLKFVRMQYMYPEHYEDEAQLKFFTDFVAELFSIKEHWIEEITTEYSRDCEAFYPFGDGFHSSYRGDDEEPVFLLVGNHPVGDSECALFRSFRPFNASWLPLSGRHTPVHTAVSLEDYLEHIPPYDKGDDQTSGDELQVADSLGEEEE